MGFASSRTSGHIARLRDMNGDFLRGFTVDVLFQVNIGTMFQMMILRGRRRGWLVAFPYKGPGNFWRLPKSSCSFAVRLPRM